jgi:hypothetical protein
MMTRMEERSRCGLQKSIWDVVHPSLRPLSFFDGQSFRFFHPPLIQTPLW